MPSSRGLAFLEFREQKKRSPSRAGHLTDRSPLPPSKSNRVRLSVCKHASLLFFRCRACVWGKKGCGSSSVNLCPGMEKGPARGPRSCCEIRPVRGPTTPARKAASPARGGRGNGARKAVRPDPYRRPKGKGGERETNGPDAGAPARAAFKLRFYHLSQGAAANGTRARRRANHRPASSGRGPMAARVLGAWAKRLLSSGRRVWAGVGAGSCLGRTWPH